MKLGCNFTYQLERVVVSKNEESFKGVLLNAEHSHEVYQNPFSYSIHQKNCPEYQETAHQAVIYRSCNIGYSESVRLLRASNLNFQLSSKAYYNLVRTRNVKIGDPATILGLIATLKNAKWRFCTRVKEVDNSIEQPNTVNPVLAPPRNLISTNHPSSEFSASLLP
jgi:hypothetical protein